MAANAVTRDVVLSLKLQADKAASKGAAQSVKSDLQSVRQAHEEMERAILESSAKTTTARANNSRKATTAAEESAKASVNSARTAAAEIEKLEERAYTASKARGEAVKATLGGIAQLARGIAQAGILPEEDMEAFIRKFAAIESMFNTVSGGISVWYGLKDAIRASRDATLAAAAANKIYAASQPVAGAAGASKVAGGVVQTGATVAGSAAAGGGASALGGLASAAGVLAAKFAFVAAGAAAGGEALSRLATAGKSGTVTEFFGLLGDRRKANEGAKDNERREAERAQRLSAASARDQKIQSVASFRADQRSQAEAFAVRRDDASGMSEIEKAQAARLRAVAEVDQAMAASAQAEERRLQRQRDGKVKSLADEMQAIERLKSARESQVAAEERILQSVRAQVSERKSAVEAARQEVESARSRVASAEDEQAGRLAQFARLSKGEQARLEKVSAKRSAGEELGRADIDFLEQTGFGSQITKDFYADQGRAAGGENVLSGLGESDALIQARKDEARAVAQQQEATTNLIRAKNEEANATRELTKSLRELAESNNQQSTAQAQQQGVDPNDVVKIQSEMGAVVSSIKNGTDAIKLAFVEQAAQIQTSRGIL